MSKFLFFLIAMVIFGLSISAQKTRESKAETKDQSPSEQLSEDDTIREIVFKKIVGPWQLDFGPELAAHKLKSYYFVIDENKDPSEGLLKRFEHLKLRAQKVSESFIDADGGYIIRDRKSGVQGLLFKLSKITWVDNSHVKVTASSYMGNMGSDGCEYILEKTDGKWQIISGEKCYVS